MASSPMDATVRNLFTLQQLGNGLDRRSRALLDGLFREVVAELIRIDPMGVSERYRAARLRKLLAELRPIVQSNMVQWQKIVRQELAEIGAHQAGVARTTLVDALGGPGAMGGLRISLGTPVLPGVNFFKAILDAEPFRGLTLSEWAAKQTRKTVEDLTMQIRLGMTAQETIPQITRRVQRIVKPATRREAEAIGRTAVTHVSNRARQETFRANEDITKEWEFIATLDSRTTPICISNDRRRFRYDDPNAPLPPLHFGCRSTSVPVVDWAGLGLEEPPDVARMAEGGVKVGAGMDYEGWLRRQSAAKQAEVLGVTRARAFRGGMSLRDLIRADGTLVSAADLADAA
jgi:SPP1 gp7 family putative phage head morphogenesis protein